MQLNMQPPEKQDLREDGHLDVHSAFYTIQGEGPFAGKPAIFVRLAGCNLQCPRCDTAYADHRWKASPGAILDLLEDFSRPGSLVVITGGEPFRQNLAPAIHCMLQAGYTVQIETNGTLFQELPFDRITVVCSPKTGSVNRRLLPHVAAFKYVISYASVAEDDLLPLTALGHPASPRLFRPSLVSQNIPIYVQPADHGNKADNKRNLDATVRAVLVHGYTLCLQIHKIIGVE